MLPASVAISNAISTINTTFLPQTRFARRRAMVANPDGSMSAPPPISDAERDGLTAAVKKIVKENERLREDVKR